MIHYWRWIGGKFHEIMPTTCLFAVSNLFAQINTPPTFALSVPWNLPPGWCENKSLQGSPEVQTYHQQAFIEASGYSADRPSKGFESPSKRLVLTDAHSIILPLLVHLSSSGTPFTSVNHWSTSFQHHFSIIVARGLSTSIYPSQQCI